jgi:ankyrin repeat protein
MDNEDDDSLSRSYRNNRVRAERLYDIAGRLGVTNDKYDDPVKLLFCSIERGDFKAAKELVENFNVGRHERDEKGRTPFSRAMDANNPRIVDLLLSRNIMEVDVADNDGVTPLWRALKRFEITGRSEIAMLGNRSYRSISSFERSI